MHARCEFCVNGAPPRDAWLDAAAWRECAVYHGRFLARPLRECEAFDHVISAAAFGRIAAAFDLKGA